MCQFNCKKHFKYYFILLLLLTNCVLLEAQDTIKTITPEDYGKWERLSRPIISNDGKWLTYGIVTNEKDKTTFLYNISQKKQRQFNNSSNAEFSENNNWFYYTHVPPGKELKKKKKNKEENKTPNKATLINLLTKDSILLEDYESFKFSSSGNYLAVKRVKDKIHTLILKDIISKKNITLGNVKEFSWHPEKDLLALNIETVDKKGNSLQLFNTINNTLQVLDQNEVDYSNLKWFEENNSLLVLRKAENEDYEDHTIDFLIWNNLDQKNTRFHIFNQNNFSNFPSDARILEQNIQLTDNGNKLYFEIFNRNKKITQEKLKESDSTVIDTSNYEAPALEIWNSKDVVIIPAQKKSKMKDIEIPKKAVWHIDENTFIQLNDSILESINIQENNKIILGLDDTPYDFDAMFGRPSHDVYIVNTDNGNKTKVLENISKTWDVSPNNQFFVYLNEDQLHLFDIKPKTSKNLTHNINANFIDFNDDHPLPQKNAFGFAGWSKDSKSFFIYSEFDVWQFFVNDLEARKLTDGNSKNIIYRIQSLERDEDYINTKEPLYYSLFGKDSKQTGYASGYIGKPVNTLILEDASISRLSRAKNEDKLIFVKQSFEQSPNLFLAGKQLNNPLQISNTNKFQKDYAWGKAELISFKNALGHEAQGILYYPANYVKGKKYPMITYIYEKLSRGLHRYSMPSKTDYYNTTIWTQNGYFVLHPDIDFITGQPGTSSTTTLENAVQSVINLGYVDSNKVGLIGHSWGGYQAGFVPTQTNIFAASVAGAGLTNLISMNLAITPAFGGRPENDHFEVGQERMGTPPHISPNNYIENSSVMQIDKLETPILFEVGDNDENVNWAQGIEYYNAARRANREFILLVYANEGHGLREDKNATDYQQRILQWFGHFLKGDKAEDWIIESIPYTEQQRRLKNNKL
ncbi:S9 family peptidase [Tamlana fucoidanivorans]|nr:prolyl oligopeptidase family serine peptidase [Tamlana fucoidanivorans]